MPDRPEFVHCVRVSNVQRIGEAWCGRRLATFEWAFVDAEHAALNGANRGRLVACPQCVEKIVAGLRNGAEDIGVPPNEGRR